MPKVTVYDREGKPHAVDPVDAKEYVASGSYTMGTAEAQERPKPIPATGDDVADYEAQRRANADRLAQQTAARNEEAIRNPVERGPDEVARAAASGVAAHGAVERGSSAPQKKR